MKKVFATMMVLAMLSVGSVAVMAQDEAAAAPEATEQVAETVADEAVAEKPKAKRTRKAKAE